MISATPLSPKKPVLPIEIDFLREENPYSLVKEVAREKGISMGKLHRAADVSYKTIKRIYSDPFYATTTITLGKLAKVPGVPPGELIEEVPDDIEERN